MSFDSEFETVALVISSDAETRGVDAFALSLIKAERQMRKLVTHLIFQYPAFCRADIPKLRGVLTQNRRVYFEGFEKGFNTLYPKCIEEIIGEDYCRLRSRLDEAINHRNKIFHGQLTPSNLSRSDLLNLVDDLRTWCSILAEGAEAEIGFDGFTRGSFQKSSKPDILSSFQVSIRCIQDYEKFAATYMSRK